MSFSQETDQPVKSNTQICFEGLRGIMLVFLSITIVCNSLVTAPRRHSKHIQWSIIKSIVSLVYPEREFHHASRWKHAPHELDVNAVWSRGKHSLRNLCLCLLVVWEMAKSQKPEVPFHSLSKYPPALIYWRIRNIA